MKNSRAKNGKAIPPPPDPDVEGYDAVIAYFMKYTTDALLKAGHLTEATPEETRELAASAAFSLLRKNGIRLELTDAECQGLAELAARSDMSVNEIVRKCIRQLLRSQARSSPRPVRVKARKKAV